MKSLQMKKSKKIKSAMFALYVGGFLCAGLALSPVSVNAAEVNVTRSISSVNVGLNQTTIVHLPREVSDIVVANPKVAGAIVRSSKDIYLFGKSVGQTNLVALDTDGNTISDISVRIERDLSPLRQALRQYLSNSDIKVSLVNDNVVLSGMVQKASDIEKATALANAYIFGGDASIKHDGQGGNEPELTGAKASGGKNEIINLIQVTGGQQVTLKVVVAEVSRNVSKQLGIELKTKKTGFGLDSLPGATGKIHTLALGTTLEAYLDSLEKSGAMKVVAEPTLTALSGETAQFKVGGEYNVINSLTVDGRSSSSLSQINYGIGLEFLPVVLSPGRISLKVVTDVSEPASNTKVPGLNGEVVSLNRRNASSTIELPSGGSMMIAGLVQNQAEHSRTAVPLVSKIPLIGAMFRNELRRRIDKELVIIVTPYLAKPGNEADYSRPTDNLEMATDVNSVFLAKVNKIYHGSGAAATSGKYHGSVGYINK